MRHYESAGRLAIDSGTGSAVSTCLSSLALIAAQVRVSEGVPELFGAAQEIERRSGGILHNAWAEDLADIERDLVDLGVVLDPSGAALSDRELRQLLRQVAAEALDALA